MVNKVTVNPLSVRGAGDIVSPKTASDFDVFNSKLVSAEEDVDGAVVTVFTESYLNGSYFSVSAPKIVAVGTESVSISAVLKYTSTDSLINSASVSCFVNGELLGTGTTSGTGVVSFTIPINDYTTWYNVRLRFAGNDNVAGCFAVFKMVQASDIGLDLTAVTNIIQVDESDPLIATLTGTGVDGETIGIPGQTVSFYETYTPCLDVSVNPEIIQSGETATVTVQLKDADDGSLIRQDGVLVSLYAVGDTVDLTSSETVLSYYDGDTTTLTEVLDSDDSVEGRSMVFKANGTVLGTVLTDSNGVAEYTYTSQGVGDVTFTASVGRAVSSGVLIEDCTDFDSLTSMSGKWTIPSTATATYSTDEMTLTGSAWSDLYFNEILSTPCTIEFDLIDYSASATDVSYFALYLWNTSKSTRLIEFTSTTGGNTYLRPYGSSDSPITYTPPKNSHIRLEIGANILTMYVDDSEITSLSYTMPSSFILGVGTGTNRSQTWKNLKIKLL